MLEYNRKATVKPSDLHSLGMCGWIRLKQTDSAFGCMLGGFQRKVHLSSSLLYSGIPHRNMVVYSLCDFTL